MPTETQSPPRENEADHERSTLPEPEPPPSPHDQEGRLPTWDELRDAISQLALEREHYAGYPMPDDECELVVHPRFPLQEMNGFKTGDKEDTESAELDLLTPEARARVAELHELFNQGKIVNYWFDIRRQTDVMIWHTKEGRARVSVRQNSVGAKATLALSTIGVSRNWDLQAEWTAMEKLASMVPEHIFKYYVTTGSFIETSPRSGVIYIFRRCRPTLAMSSRKGGNLTTLCALCMHPIGYYRGSFGGAMVPTDDVIAHLTLMRGDEHHYWKCCNQHSPWMPEAGL